MQESLSKKVNYDDFQIVIEHKVDHEILKSHLNLTAKNSDLVALKRQIEQIEMDVETKLTGRELENCADSLRAQIDAYGKEMLLKVSLKDLCGLLDQKANLNDVNSTLSIVQAEVKKCVMIDRLKQTVDDQRLINDALCAENCVGRWLWKSGDLCSQAQVPWEVQAINTCPDNFLWDAGKSPLTAVAPGLYQLSLGFFAKKPRNVSVLVNGEVIFTVKSPSQAVSQKSTFEAITAKGKHSAGNVTGLSLSEFVAIPARARITLVYEGEGTSGEGFVCLRKL